MPFLAVYMSMVQLGLAKYKDILQILKADPATWKHFEKFPMSYKQIRIVWIDADRPHPDIFNQRLKYKKEILDDVMNTKIYLESYRLLDFHFQSFFSMYVLSAFRVLFHPPSASTNLFLPSSTRE